MIVVTSQRIEDTKTKLPHWNKEANLFPGIKRTVAVFGFAATSNNRNYFPGWC